MVLTSTIREANTHFHKPDVCESAFTRHPRLHQFTDDRIH